MGSSKQGKGSKKQEQGQGQGQSKPAATPKPIGTVKVGRVPGKIIEVEYRQGMTVGDAFNKAQVDRDGCKIQRNGQTAKLKDTVERGDSILAISNIRGN